MAFSWPVFLFQPHACILPYEPFPNLVFQDRDWHLRQSLPGPSDAEFAFGETGFYDSPVLYTFDFPALPTLPAIASAHREAESYAPSCCLADHFPLSCALLSRLARIGGFFSWLLRW